MESHQTFVKMPVINPHAADIDIGSKFNVIALDNKNTDVKDFRVYTDHLYELAQYLKDNHIQTVAMEVFITSGRKLSIALKMVLRQFW